jgi:basic membrane lipoprotein Med (substrate-binding protein (PBP1-ABC) superfamily)
MGFFDTALIISIAIMYNLTVHSIAAASYKNEQYQQKMINTSVFLILFGGIGILIAKILKEKNKEFEDSSVSKGLYYGGILLILTSIFANWENIAEELKLLAIAGILGGLIWFGYKKDKTKIQKKKIESKINEEILNELIPEDDIE